MRARQCKFTGSAEQIGKVHKRLSAAKPQPNIPLLAEEGWRAAPGWSARRSVVAGLLLRLRPAGLALRATPSAPRVARRIHSSSARRGILRMRHAIRCLFVLSLALFARAQTLPSYLISYRLAMSRPASHLFEVTIDISIPAADTSAFVDLQMPRWQPGRYSVADFAKNVQQFRAQSQNQPLEWDKVDDQTWRVQRRGQRIITATY